MRNFQDIFETRKGLFIGAFSICMTVPLSNFYDELLISRISFFNNTTQRLEAAVHGCSANGSQRNFSKIRGKNLAGRSISIQSNFERLLLNMSYVKIKHRELIDWKPRTILVIIFWKFIVFQYRSDSPKVKRNKMSTITNLKSESRLRTAED